jgi:hypothetical protein
MPGLSYSRTPDPEVVDGETLGGARVIEVLALGSHYPGDDEMVARS